MTPLILPSAIELVAQTAANLLDSNISEQDALWIMTTALVVEALRRTKGNKCKAARLLGMHRNTLNRHAKKRALTYFVQDLRSLVEIVQMELFGKKKSDKSCTASNSLCTENPKHIHGVLQRVCA